MTRMISRQPVIGSMAMALLLSVWMATSLWKPITRILKAAHTAEIQRLLQGFEEPIREAVNRGDDIAKIDLIKRIERLPGVVHVHADSSSISLPLTIQVAQTPWKRLRYQVIERMGTLIVLLTALGGVFGVCATRLQKRTHARLFGLLQRDRLRRARIRGDLLKTRDAEILPWVRQAISFYPAGLVLLDPQQHVVACNASALRYFNLAPEAIGTHWLDLKTHPIWAHALTDSLGHPGERIPFQDTTTGTEISLITFSSFKNVPESTWIILPLP